MIDIEAEDDSRDMGTTYNEISPHQRKYWFFVKNVCR
jgi:hypothetical protein